MKRSSETGFIGCSGYSLKPNTNRIRIFYVQTIDTKVYDMMTDLCSLGADKDEEISNLVRKRDFNYIDIAVITELHKKYFSGEKKENE